MFYHQKGSFPLGNRQRAEKNRRRKEILVNEGQSHGIIVYSKKTPVGWCQYGTKEELPRLDASRTYQKMDPYKGQKKLWRVTCFFVDRDFRRKGVANFALNAALTSIGQRGGGTVEAYPLESLKDVPRSAAKGKASFLWSGTLSMFKGAGFKVARPLGKSRRLVRRTVS